MKLLVISDIHGNWPALRAIPEAADAVICLGDIVSYGPFPRECLAWVRERAAHVVRGNHDTALALQVDSGAAAFKQELARATLARHWAQVSEDDLAWLRDLPTEIRFRSDDFTFLAMHAAPKDHLFSYRLTPDLPDDELKKEVEEVRADILLVGHTHLPMSRGAWTKVVLNPGSVGQPLDGDPRASYAVVENGVAEIRRVAYDLEETVAGLRAMGLPTEAAEALIAILRSGGASHEATGASGTESA
jgi:putative phosphoesterase